MKDWKQHKVFIKLLIIIAMVPFSAWVFGFRQTVNLWMEYSVQQENVEKLHAEDTGKPLEPWEDGLTSKQVLNNGVLLEQLSGPVKDNRVTIVKYTPYLTREEGMLQVNTGELVLAGEFVSLLKVMNHVEHNGNLGKIISSGFQVFQDRAKKEKQLRMTLVIQQLTVGNK